MMLIALLPSLVAGWLFIGTLRLRGAKARQKAATVGHA
jgi:hypothetical protein